jgi:hypothetical protein
MNVLQQRRIKKKLANCLYALADLQQAFFVNYLRKDYIKHQLRYQKALYSSSKHFFCATVNASRIIKNKPRYLEVFEKISHVSEIIFSMNQLRLRVDDYTTFKICARELQGIEKFSTLLLKQLAVSLFKKNDAETMEFEQKIHDFEGSYNRTLQIVSVDPLVFMFFIQDLYAFYDEVKSLQKAILLLQEKTGSE